MLRLSTGLRNMLAGLRADLITNGAFTSVTTGWTAVTATLTSAASGQSGNCLSVAESGGSDPGKAYQDITTVIGRLYKLVAYFKKGTADGGKIMVGTTGDENAIYESAALSDAAWTKYDIYFVATATTTRITLQSTDVTAAETSFFDTVSCVDMAGTLKEIFDDCFIDIYSGSQPTTADGAPTGTKLATFFSDGSAAGLGWDDPASGRLPKATAETWSGPGLVDGTAGWFRIRTAADAGGSSTTLPRIDGAIATSGSEMDATSVAVVSAATQTITTFGITIPASA
jgi:hypothetical protein